MYIYASRAIYASIYASGPLNIYQDFMPTKRHQGILSGSARTLDITMSSDTTAQHSIREVNSIYHL